MLRGAFFGLFFAAIGAAGWAAVSMATDMRLGFLAIAVGGLAGFGMGVGNKARGGLGAGFLTAIVAALAILASRYAVMHLSVQAFLNDGAQVTPEEAVYSVAEDVQAELLADGVELPESEDDEYAPFVMEEAQSRWDALSPTQQQEYMAALGKHYAEQGERVAGFVTFIAFLVDFGLFGFVWLGLGVATAYQIGATAGQTDPATQAISGEADGATEGFWARAAPSTDPNAVMEQRMQAERTGHPERAAA